MDKKLKITYDQKSIDNSNEKQIFKEKVKERLLNLKNKSEKEALLYSEQTKGMYSETKKSLNINSDLKNDNLTDCLHLFHFIDKEKNNIDANHKGRKIITYDINDITLDFLNSDIKNTDLTYSNLELSKIPEFLYDYIEINQFFQKQSKFMKKNKLFNQSIGITKLVVYELKKLIANKVECLNDIQELKATLRSEVEKEKELLILNQKKNKEKNQKIINQKHNNNIVKNGINSLNNALELKNQIELVDSN